MRFVNNFTMDIIRSIVILLFYVIWFSKFTIVMCKMANFTLINNYIEKYYSLIALRAKTPYN